MSAVVHLLRHGEVFNPEHVLYGRLPNFRLSELGEQQAVLAAEHLADRDVTDVTASPLLRAQQTAAPLAATFGFPIGTDDRLIEAGNEFEGQPIGAGMFLRPGNWWHLRNPRRPSWGEPYLQIAQRMRAAVLAAADRADGHEAVVVSHQLPVVCLRRSVEHLRLAHDPRRRQCGLASLTTVSVEGPPGDERVRFVAYAEPAGHLGGVGTGA